MKIGVPRETKDQEHRVGMTPDGVRALVEDGHTLLVERGAGVGSGFPDEAYRRRVRRWWQPRRPGPRPSSW
jgi:alanine dehydrogenase